MTSQVFPDFVKLGAFPFLTFPDTFSFFQLSFFLQFRLFSDIFSSYLIIYARFAICLCNIFASTGLTFLKVHYVVPKTKRGDVIIMNITPKQLCN